MEKPSGWDGDGGGGCSSGGGFTARHNWGLLTKFIP